MGKPRIRPIALGLIKHQDHVFVSKGKDMVNGEDFYRFLGGGIDFRETSLKALEREFQEELQAELTNIRYLTCLDNIFTYNDKPGHELIQLFQCDFIDPSFYKLDHTYTFVEGKHQRDAIWISIEQVQSGTLNLVPSNCRAFIYG